MDSKSSEEVARLSNGLNNSFEKDLVLFSMVALSLYTIFAYDLSFVAVLSLCSNSMSTWSSIAELVTYSFLLEQLGKSQVYKLVK